MSKESRAKPDSRTLLVALGRPGQGVVDVAWVEHTPAAVGVLVARIATLEPDPAEVRVVIETRHGLLVEAMLDAGYTVLPVNPDLVARRRGASEEERRRRGRADRLPAGPRSVHPVAGPSSRTGTRPENCGPSPATTCAPPATSGGCSTGCAPTWPPRSRPRWSSPATSWGSPVLLKLLQRWPTAAELGCAEREEIEALARAAKPGVAVGAGGVAGVVEDAA
ncbi:MAG: hypothetical protein ACRDQ7_09085 [Haloechinothrix sp.]